MSNSMIGNTNDLKYIGTFQGKFTIRTNESDPDGVSRVNKLGNTVHEIQFNKLTGRLTEIKEKDGEYGARYHFIIDNGTEKAALETSLNSNLASSIINRLPNLDLSQPFEIVARWNVSKERALFFINQNDEEVKDFFQDWDKEAKKWTLNHGFPAWEKITVNGTETWDSSKQIAYQKKVIAKYMAEIESNVPFVEPMIEADPQPEDDGDDPLPF